MDEECCSVVRASAIGPARPTTSWTRALFSPSALVSSCRRASALARDEIYASIALEVAKCEAVPKGTAFLLSVSTSSTSETILTSGSELEVGVTLDDEAEVVAALMAMIVVEGRATVTAEEVLVASVEVVKLPASKERM